MKIKVQNIDGTAVKGGDIELGAPGSVEFKAAKKDWTEPKSALSEFLELPKTEGSFAQCFALYSLEGTALEGAKVTLFDPILREVLWDGEVDASGKTTLDVTPNTQNYMALAGFDSWSSSFEDLDLDSEDEEEQGRADDSEEDGREEEAATQGGWNV